MMNWRAVSLDHLVGEREQLRRNFQPEPLSSFEVHDQLKELWAKVGDGVKG
jgi:hypothetical protein